MVFIFLDCFCVSFRVLKVSVLGMFAFSQMAPHAVRTFFLSAKLHHGRKQASTQRRHDYYSILDKAGISTADIPKTLQLTPKHSAGMNNTNMKK